MSLLAPLETRGAYFVELSTITVSHCSRWYCKTSDPAKHGAKQEGLGHLRPPVCQGSETVRG